jgi:hypothetical protein
MDRTDSKLLTDLRTKLAKPGDPPVSHQAVQQRRAKLQAVVPMPNDIATYIVAQREGVKLHTYLDEPKLDQVATWEQRLNAKQGGPSAGLQPAKTMPATRIAIVKELHLDRVKVPDAALSAGRKVEAERMAAVYPMLYAFENSVREFIDGHLAAKLGKDWFDDPRIVGKKTRDTVERNKAAEGRNRYHSRRSARAIHYTNIDDLSAIMMSQKGWQVFKSMFPSDRWLPSIIEKVEASRNVVAHMNPLEKRDIDRIRLNFEDWLAQIKGHAPPASP